MSSAAFALLYALCLACCLGAVQGARMTWGGRAAEPPVLEPSVAIAIPPKPETERMGEAQQGAGEPVLYDEARCRGYEEQDLRDVCFHALARQRAARDVEGALLACQEVQRRRLRLECMADVGELHSGTDLARARAVCESIESRKWHDQCYFGIAMDQVSRDPAQALATCGDAGIWRDFCRHDVLGEVAVVDLDFVLEVCSEEQGDLLTRKTCWHGIGKYIGRQDLEAAFAACQRVPLGPDRLYRENCVHGAGWAAGERWGAAGAQRCSAGGAQSESCLLGVAFQLKRLAPEEAVSICQSVGRSDLRRHCLAFVGS